MLRRFLHIVLGRRSTPEAYRENNIPPQYRPWLTDLVPIASALLKQARLRINLNRHDNIRILFAFFIAGLCSWYANHKGLTTGEKRYLTTQVLLALAWPYKAAGLFADLALASELSLPAGLQSLRPYVEDALEAGARCGRAHFLESDIRVLSMPTLKLNQWKDAGLM